MRLEIDEDEELDLIINLPAENLIDSSQNLTGTNLERKDNVIDLSPNTSPFVPRRSEKLIGSQISYKNMKIKL